MSPVTDTLSSTAPVRAWYLARQCLGPVAIVDWEEESDVTAYLLDSLFGRNFSAIVPTWRRDWTDWWVATSSETSSVRRTIKGIVAPLQEHEQSAQTTASALGSENQVDLRITHSIARLYELADEEWFEDGLQSNLSIGLEVLLRQYPAKTMSALSKALTRGAVGHAALVETLKVLGRAESPETRDPRLYTILDFLNHASLVVRDAALVALCLLNDTRAVAYLDRAISREDDPFFRNELAEAINQLRAL